VPTTRTVLVVDDEPGVASHLKVLLEDHGYRALATTRGEQALRLARDEAPDLICLDFAMPAPSGIRGEIGLDGLRDTRESRMPGRWEAAHMVPTELLLNQILIIACLFMGAHGDAATLVLVQDDRNEALVYHVEREGEGYRLREDAASGGRVHEVTRAADRYSLELFGYRANLEIGESDIPVFAADGKADTTVGDEPMRFTREGNTLKIIPDRWSHWVVMRLHGTCGSQPGNPTAQGQPRSSRRARGGVSTQVRGHD
jgi:CheY-like chemotaxis protein